MQTSDQIEENDPGIEMPTVKDGMLVFKDKNHLFQTINWLQKFDEDKRTEIEKKYFNGFISQRIIYNQILEEENKMVELFLKKKVHLKNDSPQRSPLFLEKLKSGIITEEKDENGYTSFRLSLSNPFFAEVINENGFIIIGDSIVDLYMPNDIIIEMQNSNLRSDNPPINPNRYKGGSVLWLGDYYYWETRDNLYRVKMEYAVGFFQKTRYTWSGLFYLYENAEKRVGSSWYKCNYNLEWEVSFKSYSTISNRDLFGSSTNWFYQNIRNTPNVTVSQGGSVLYRVVHIFNGSGNPEYSFNYASGQYFEIGVVLNYISLKYKIFKDDGGIDEYNLYQGNVRPGRGTIYLYSAHPAND